VGKTLNNADDSPILWTQPRTFPGPLVESTGNNLCTYIHILMFTVTVADRDGLLLDYCWMNDDGKEEEQERKKKGRG
jgi:hypothetical protein